MIYMDIMAKNIVLYLLLVFYNCHLRNKSHKLKEVEKFIYQIFKAESKPGF